MTDQPQNSSEIASAPLKPKFVHLRVHSAYSLSEGALRVPQLVELCKADNMPAMALTDTNNMFGALEYSTYMSGGGIQPIHGVTLSVRFDVPTLKGQQNQLQGDNVVYESDGNIVLLAKNRKGYENLMEVISRAYLDTADVEPAHLLISTLEKYHEGLICLTGGPDGPIDKMLLADHIDQAGQWLDYLKHIFADRLYVELQRHDHPNEKKVEPLLLKLAYDRELPIVATNQAFFEKTEDYTAHDALLCIAAGSYVTVEDRRKVTPRHFFTSQEEMAKIFADLPEALENTVEIAQRCAYRVTVIDPLLPCFVDGQEGVDPNATPEELFQLEATELTKQAKGGLYKRLEQAGIAEGFEEKDYFDRLDFELNIIIQMKFPGYFLIVSDFIKWSIDHGIPVGPGRGSGAGSVVAWSLMITDLDPMRFGLLFERFLNPERVSMPDFDIDFCQSRREEVISYVQKKYGHDKVGQIITFGKLQAKAVIRDVGRVLQMPYPQVDRLSKLIPPDIGITLAESLEQEKELRDERDNDQSVADLLAIALKLEGLYRHASTHAAGVVIGDRPLKQLVTLYKDPKSDWPVTQFNMKWVEQCGLVKFDFLGLKTLTVIQKALQLIEEKGVTINFHDNYLKDIPAYELLARGDTVGVFQLESTGMQESLKALKPDRFEDIIAMVSLYRPGPMDNIPTYINRKFGREEPDYLHPKLKGILEETFGVIIYQEQVMQIAQVLSGYSLGDADLLRRAMGKKIAAEMDKQRKIFVDGAVERDVDAAQADFIFDLVNKFAGYGFNKSHAAAYALLSYQTAFLKANHPVEFMAGIMTLDQGNTEKICLFAQELRNMDIEILPPCINKSVAEFRPENGAVRFSLGALKNMGVEAVKEMCLERDENGPFKSLDDFASRINPKTMNKRGLETLVGAGAFDSINENRGMVFANIGRIMETAQRKAMDRQIGQDDLFGDSGAADSETALELKQTRGWPPMELLNRELKAIGFFLSGHPLDEYTELLTQLKVRQWADFIEEVREKKDDEEHLGTLAGIVGDRREMISKKGNKFAFAEFTDQSGMFDMIMFSDTLDACRDKLEKGNPVYIRVSAQRNPEDHDQIRMRLLNVEELNSAAERLHKEITVVINDIKAVQHIAENIQYGGKGIMRLIVRLEEEDQQVEMTLPGSIVVDPGHASLLRVLPGVCEVTEV